MPVLPDVGSRMRWPGATAPSASARSIIDFATRSLTEPGRAVELELREEPHARLRAEPLQLDDRRVADRPDHVGAAVRRLPQRPGLQHARRIAGAPCREPSRLHEPAGHRGQDHDRVAGGRRRSRGPAGRARPRRSRRRSRSGSARRRRRTAGRASRGACRPGRSGPRRRSRPRPRPRSCRSRQGAAQVGS